MKKILSLLISASILLCINPDITYAQTPSISTYDLKYIGEDIYIETIIIEHGNNISRTTTTKTASKISNIKNSDNEILATFKLTGTFIYDHITSRCTNATYTTSIYNDNWSFTSTSATKSGISAKGSYTATCCLLGFEVTSVSENITLSCDANGNVY